MTVYALFFATLKRRARRKSIGPELFFERKIVDFPFKKQLRSLKILFRMSFERSEKQCVNCVVCLEVILSTHLFTQYLLK